MATTSIRRRAALGAIFLLATLVAAPASASAGEDCYRVNAKATTVMDPATGVFSGTAHFFLNGISQAVPASAWATGPTSSVHVFEFDQGTIVTEDILILVPVHPDDGIYSLQSKLFVTAGGSGRMQLAPSSRIDLVNGIATWTGKGSICFA